MGCTTSETVAIESFFSSLQRQIYFTSEPGSMAGMNAIRQSTGRGRPAEAASTSGDLIVPCVLDSTALQSGAPSTSHLPPVARRIGVAERRRYLNRPPT